MGETHLENSAEPVLLTYYEICLDDQEPLIGSLTYEHVDLREALNQLKERRQTDGVFELRIKLPKDQLQKLLNTNQQGSESMIEFTVLLSLADLLRGQDHTDLGLAQ